MIILSYQDLRITIQNTKALATILKSLAEQGVKSVTLSKNGIEYVIGRQSLFLGSIGYRNKTEDYPEGITATGHARLDIKTSYWKKLGSHPTLSEVLL